MKRIFVVLLVIVILLSSRPNSHVFAGSWFNEEVSVYNAFDVVSVSDGYQYTFYFYVNGGEISTPYLVVYYGNYDGDLSDDVKVVDASALDGNYAETTYTDASGTVYNLYTATCIVEEEYDITYNAITGEGLGFFITKSIKQDSWQDGDRYYQTPVMYFTDGDPFVTPTPSNTPTPTPEPDDTTPTPEPDDTTPTPEPTETIPSPTPVIPPNIKIHAYVSGWNVIAEYDIEHIDGYTPINSTITLYQIDDNGNKIAIDADVLINNNGLISINVNPTYNYQYNISYTYEDEEGNQHTEEEWSDIVKPEDEELDNYRENPHIYNLRTLMLYIWEEVMELTIPIEGFEISIKTLFIWIIIASLLVFFYKKFSGM